MTKKQRVAWVIEIFFMGLMLLGLIILSPVWFPIFLVAYLATWVLETNDKRREEEEAAKRRSEVDEWNKTYGRRR